MSNGLVRTKGALATMREPSWKLTLNGILTTTAQVTRKELAPAELLLWERLLENCHLDGLEWAFAEYLRGNKFFPVPAEILELYATWVTTEENKRRDASERAEREETERRRARGETFGIAEVGHEFNRIVSEKAIPAPIPISMRRAELQGQKVRIMKAIENTGKPRRQ
jgi:hypothetical protein